MSTPEDEKDFMDFVNAQIPGGFNATFDQQNRVRERIEERTAMMLRAEIMKEAAIMDCSESAAMAFVLSMVKRQLDSMGFVAQDLGLAETDDNTGSGAIAAVAPIVKAAALLDDAQKLLLGDEEMPEHGA